jgi:predicted TIM-barrel fold metal-dependent hydrolase
LDFVSEVGMIAILHNDIDAPFPKPGQEPYQAVQLRKLVTRHPKATIIWAHVGLGRIVTPAKGQLGIIEKVLSSSDVPNLYIDISWDETAKYLVATPETTAATAALINKFPDRFIFGSDVVAPKSLDAPLAVYNMYEPLWKALTPEASEKVRLGNYQRLFDAARVNVRAWEKANVNKPKVVPQPVPSSGEKVPQ